MSSVLVARFYSSIAKDNGPVPVPVIIEVSWVKHLFSGGAQGYHVTESIGGREASSLGKFPYEQHGTAIRRAVKRYLLLNEEADIAWRRYAGNLRAQRPEPVPHVVDQSAGNAAWTAQPELHRSVILKLEKAGLQASWEHPGYIRVDAGGGYACNVGTANGPWGYDFTDAEDASVEWHDAHSRSIWQKFDNLKPNREHADPDDLAALIVCVIADFQIAHKLT